MTVPGLTSNRGHRVFGAAVFAFGAITLMWPDCNDWLRLHAISNEWTALMYFGSAAEMLGGVAIQFRRTAKMGAALIAVVYFVFALLCIPRIVAAPTIYDNWGNFFEQFSILIGAAVLYAHWSSAWTPERLKRIGSICFGICTISFTLEQAFYLLPTARLVPRWIPPNQMFWAVATTVLFALAALALLTNLQVLFATRLLTGMLVSFGILVWIPLLVSAPRNPANWSETTETFAIAGTAWILADLLAKTETQSRGAPYTRSLEVTQTI